MTYSFDIFDTCFVRTCGSPDFVFDIIAEKVLGKNSSITEKMDFAYIRRNAERIARQKLVNKDCEDISIEEIYSFADFSTLTSVPNEKILAIEIEVEKEVLLPVFETKERIREIHEKGDNVIYISDMYLHSSFLLNLLTENGFFIPGDRLFVSSEERKTKQSGNLFKYIHDSLSLSYKNWHHYGDNIQSDYRIPKKLGIKSHLLQYPYTLYEMEFQKYEFEGDKMNRLLLSSISRALRLSNQPSPYSYFACDFIAPMFVPFVYSILDDARNRNINDIYFLSRDGYIFYNIALKFCDMFPSLRLHYIFVSRKSLYLPSLDVISYETLKERLAFINDIRLCDVLDRFQLTSYMSHFERYTSKKNDELLYDLLKDQEFVNLLTQKRDEQKQLCLEYFIQTGLTRGNAAVVDLSGTRKCHVAINKILKSNNYPSVFGYYFDVLNNRIVGSDYCSLLFQDRYKYNKHIEKKPQSVFEQYFCITDQDSTAGYMKKNGIVYPIYDIDGNDKRIQKEIFETNKNICQSFSTLFIRLVDTSLSKYYVGNALSVFNLFYYVPDPYFTQAFVGLTYSNGKLYIKPFIRTKGLIDCLRNIKKTWFFPSLVCNSNKPYIVMKALLFFHFLRSNIKYLTR